MKSLVDTTRLSTLQIGGLAKSLLEIRKKEDVLNIPKNTPVIGGGSNIVFSDNIENLSIARMKILGIKVLEEKNKTVTIKVGAGESWDGFVKFCIDKNFSGIEALSGIPGTVGAAPIQNIGAYGSEVKDSISRVETYNRSIKKFEILENKDCKFSYRDSIFKRNPKRWIVTNVIFKFNKNKKNAIPKYKDVENYFKDKNISSPSLLQIREIILEIRSNKLPDPSVIPNCGSFFKNPFVDIKVAKKIKKEFPDIKVYPEKNLIKIPAGFLIDSLGFKGKKFGGIEVYKNNALVLTNPNKASFSDLIYAKNEIQKAVFEKFGITLEPEVNIIL